MRSSGSTTSRSPDRPIPLWLLVAGEDHPKACTGRRLLRRRLALPLTSGHRPRRPPILLDPHAKEPLSPADRELARSGGVLAIDCSWNRLAERGGYPEGADWLRRLSTRRRLPWLIAANPQHYGRLAELNTAEALAAALMVLGEQERAWEVVGVSPGGVSFLTINRARLDGYSSANSSTSVRTAEAGYFH